MFYSFLKTIAWRSSSPEKLWKTKGGRLVKISEMADSHLLNAERLFRNRVVSYKNICEEIEKRGLKIKL